MVTIFSTKQFLVKEMERIQVWTFSLRFRRAPFSTTKNYIWAVGLALWNMHAPRVHFLAAETK